jgi:GntR family transcriptional regulator
MKGAMSSSPLSSTLSAAHPAAQLDPLYRQVATRLREDIRSGALAVGTVLPPLRDLAEEWKVSQQTMRGALELLRAAGLVSTRRRGGTRIEATHVDRSGQVMAALDNILTYSDNVRLRVTAKETVIARTGVAELLQSPPGRPWFRISGYRHLAGDPTPRVHSEVFINAAYPLVFERINSRTKRIYAMFGPLYGEDFVEFRQELRTVPLSADARSVLGASDEGMELGLRYINRFFGEFGDVMEVAVNVHRLDDPNAALLRRPAVMPRP